MQPTFWIATFSALLCAANIYGLWVGRRFIERLKSDHRPVWLEMGGPELVNTESSSQANRLFFFIVFGKFYKYGDPILNKDGASLQVVAALSLVSLIMLFILLRTSQG